MDKRSRCDYKTEFSNILQIVKSITKPNVSDREFIDRIIGFFQQFCAISEINPHLKSIESLTDTQRLYLKVYFLRTVLDIKTLQSLCLFPPNGIQYERWQCICAPCNSSVLLRSFNLFLVQDIRKKLGLNDNLPENFFSRFQELQLKQNGRKLVEFPSVTLSPLILFPLKYFSSESKKKIQENFPSLDNVPLDGLFLCCDHFGPAKINGRDTKLHLPLRSSAIFNYSLEYLKDIVDKGLANLRVGRNGAWTSSSMDFLAYETLAGPNDVHLEPIQHLPEESVHFLKNISHQMELPSRAPKPLVDKFPHKSTDELIREIVFDDEKIRTPPPSPLRQPSTPLDNPPDVLSVIISTAFENQFPTASGEIDVTMEVQSTAINMSTNQGSAEISAVPCQVPNGQPSNPSSTSNSSELSVGNEGHRPDGQQSHGVLGQKDHLQVGRNPNLSVGQGDYVPGNNGPMNHGPFGPSQNSFGKNNSQPSTEAHLSSSVSESNSDSASVGTSRFSPIPSTSRQASTGNFLRNSFQNPYVPPFNHFSESPRTMSANLTENNQSANNPGMSRGVTGNKDIQRHQVVPHVGNYVAVNDGFRQKMWAHEGWLMEKNSTLIAQFEMREEILRKKFTEDIEALKAEVKELKSERDSIQKELEEKKKKADQTLKDNYELRMKILRLEYQLDFK